MALDVPPLPVPVSWPDHSYGRDRTSPTSSSPKSQISTTSSAFSAEAPSSQSSVSSASTPWSQTYWERQSWKNGNESNVEETISGNCSQITGNDFVFPRNPRRTRRLDSNGARAPLPPPQLVRQTDRKLNFVDSLVDTTTLMVETIWPLSNYTNTRQADTSRQPSKTDLRYFIQEVLKRSKASYSTLQVALYYLVLIRPHVPKHDFTHEQPDSTAASFSLQCGRRMFIAALILASKYLQDRNFSASGWSKISGLSTWDLNVNEMAFLKAIDWKLHVPDQLFNKWTDIVLKYSPTSHQHARSRPILSWREVVLRLTPELNTIDFDELSDDSGYCSPGSDSTGDMSPPPIPIRDSLMSRSNNSTPGRSIGQWLEQTPTVSATSTVPSRPQPAPLPTPNLTPQTNQFCTPAVSALSVCPSMRGTMSQIQASATQRCTLDRVSDWRPRLSANSIRSPESVLSDASSQYSDQPSSRPSRSSSISSVASSSCAPAHAANTPLAVQATRRCANMVLNGCSSIGGSKTSEVITPTLSNRKRSYDLLREMTQNVAMKENATQEEDQLAATALRDLALGVAMPAFSTKRLRPNRSTSSGTESDGTLTPTPSSRPVTARCLTDLTNLPTPTASPEPVSSDMYASNAAVAASASSPFLLRKENRHPIREANKKPTKSARKAKKSGSAGSDRGGRGEVRREVSGGL